MGGGRKGCSKKENGKEGMRRRRGNIWSWVCSQLARVEVRV